MIVCNPLRNSLWLVGAQVLERWLTCVCWHMTWNSWIVSIEIVRKCLFNTRFSSFYFHLYLLRNSKVLFDRAQRREMLISVFLILTLWFWLDFGVRCVGTFYASVGEKIQKEMSFLSVLTCVHYPMSLSRTSGIRNVTNLCLLACDLEFMDCCHRNRP